MEDKDIPPKKFTNSKLKSPNAQRKNFAEENKYDEIFNIDSSTVSKKMYSGK